MTIPRNLSFLAQGADSTGVLSVPYGGTGNVTLTAGYIPYGNGTSAFGSSSNLFWSSANNRLGLGTTSPSYTLDVTGTFRNTGIARLGTGATTTIANIGDDGTVGTKIIQFSRASAVSDVVNIQGINAGVGATYIALQALGGGVSIGNTTDPGSGNLSVTGTGKFNTTIGVGAATPAASGAGITFPATPSASTDANTLDDYEEGTWTPSVGGLATYTLQDGNYVKIGRQVTCTGKLIINLIATGSATTVSGLPFTCQSTANGTTGKGVFGYFGSLATNVTSITIDVVNNTTTFTTACLTAAAGATSYSPNIFQNGTRIDFSLTYIASA